MPIQLPTSPTNGQQVATGGKTYQWNGRFWKIVSSTSTGGGGSSGPAAWADITDKPTSFTPAAHAHSIGAVAGLQEALDGKQPMGGGGASFVISDTAPNHATYPIWFTLTGEQFVWDGEAWFQVPGVPGADGQDGVDGQDGTGSSQSAILSWAI